MRESIHLKLDYLKNVLQTITQPVKILFSKFLFLDPTVPPHVSGRGVCCIYKHACTAPSLCRGRNHSKVQWSHWTNLCWVALPTTLKEARLWVPGRGDTALIILSSTNKGVSTVPCKDYELGVQYELGVHLQAENRAGWGEFSFNSLAPPVPFN